ncbi:MAG: hypothetical protein IT303_10815 [Dehalococcoidia bacterium]|nr:hypothetical protein [Dehalococcoidia bacterium]
MSKDATKQQVGRIGGLTTHATSDSSAIAARARAGLTARFEREVREHAVEKGEVLSDSELARRIEMTRRVYYARLALKSAEARRKGALSGS